MKSLSTRRRAAAALAVATGLALSACSGGGGAADGEGPEKDSLTIAINPSSQFAPLFYGIESGIFEDNGLDIEIVPQTDIAAIISGIASGQYDFGFATVVHVVTANANGIPVRAVSSIEGQVKPDDEGTVTVADAGTGIEDFADLEGKRVATIGLSSHNTLTLRELVDMDGADPMSMEMVQMPFGQMAAALENDDVDAAIMQWPFANDALEAGGTPLGYNNRELFANTATTLFNTSQQFIDENPQTVEAFSDSIVASIEAATEDPDAARETLVDGLDITPEQAEVARWNIGGEPHLNLDAFEKAQELLVKFSEDDAAASAIGDLDVSTVVWPGALEQ